MGLFYVEWLRNLQHLILYNKNNNFETTLNNKVILKTIFINFIESRYIELLWK